jgi:hypothetical protein
MFWKKKSISRSILKITSNKSNIGPIRLFLPQSFFPHDIGGLRDTFDTVASLAATATSQAASRTSQPAAASS